MFPEEHAFSAKSYLNRKWIPFYNEYRHCPTRQSLQKKEDIFFYLEKFFSICSLSLYFLFYCINIINFKVK